MHRLLKRQLKKVYGDTLPTSPEFARLMSLVDQGYQDFDHDISLLGRSLDVSSDELNRINANLNGLLNALPDTCIWLDADNRVREIRGADGLDEVLFNGEPGQPLCEVFSIKHCDEFMQHLQGVRAGTKPDSYDFEVNVSGDAIYVEARFTQLGKSLMLIIFRDVTVRTLVENLRTQALEESRLHQRQLQDLINSAPIGIVITNLDNDILMLNQYAVTKFNISANEVTNTRFEHMLPETKREAYQAFLKDFLARKQEGISDARIDIVITPDNTDHFVAELRLSTLNLDGETIITQTFLDISERKEFERKLKQLAQTDPLTGCHNRRHYSEMAEKQLILCRSQKQAFSLMLMDLDKFKNINDTYGHGAGDEVLKVFASVTQGLIREGDILGRYGGEEFILALPNTPKAVARKIAQRICDQIALQQIEDSGNTIIVTASIGLVSSPKSNMDLESMTKIADDLLYEAKANGRNRVES